MTTTILDLPPEIIHNIVSYLPTLSSITNAAQTCRKLHDAIFTGKNVIYHAFVRRQFPTIKASPPWQDTAFKLTSRSRAWDRRALVARECAPPGAREEGAGHRVRGQVFGFIPVIDSYETNGSHGSKEVLAWGAAGRLRVRTTHGKRVEWSSWRTPNDASPWTDILDLRLLRPHQNRNKFGESVFIRRANRELSLLHAMPEEDSWVIASQYLVKPDTSIDCVDVSDGAEPLAAVCDSGTIQLFPLHTSEPENRAQSIAAITDSSTLKQRKRCAKFLSDSRLAIAAQYLEGLQKAPIEIFDISPTGLTSTPLCSLQDLEAEKSSFLRPTGRIGANVLAKVDENSSVMADTTSIILSGWSDGLVRLYDVRSGQEPVCKFSDPVDDGQIFSLLPIGQERFLAGSHQNACLKVFDMRMDRRVYAYREVAPQHVPGGTEASTAVASAPAPAPAPWSSLSSTTMPPRLLRGTNIFLALTVHRAAQPWQPLPGRHNNTRLPRYRGSIYSLSSPSPSSATVYAGIENHVIQLDSVSTDDWEANLGGLREPLDDRPILNLSCYERPRDGRESTDTVLLRKQGDIGRTSDQIRDVEHGWDERWQLETQRSRKGMAASWWAGRH